MKNLFIALLLCMSLTATQVFGQVESINPETEVHASSVHEPKIITGVVVAIALTVGVLGLFVIIKVSCRMTAKPPAQGTIIKVVLERSADNVNWAPAATNNVIWDTNSPPINYWRERIQRDPVFYRIKIVE